MYSKPTCSHIPLEPYPALHNMSPAQDNTKRDDTPNPHGEPHGEPSPHPAIFLIFIIQIAVLALSCLWGKLAQLPWWDRLHWGPWILGGAGTGILLALITHGIFHRLARRLQPIRWFLYEFLSPLFAGQPLGIILALALLSGLAEEALFRGILLPLWGLTPSSILFGILHTGDRRLFLPGLWAMLVGFGLGWLMTVTNELSICVTIHGMNNLVSLWLLQGMARQNHLDQS